MSCGRMEKKIVGYVDGRLKEGERLEMEKHLSRCAPCQLRVNEFRAVNVLLDEAPMIEPSAAFDVRVWARVAAEPAKEKLVGHGSRRRREWRLRRRCCARRCVAGLAACGDSLNASEVEKINQNLPVLENF